MSSWTKGLGRPMDRRDYNMHSMSMIRAGSEEVDVPKSFYKEKFRVRSLFERFNLTIKSLKMLKSIDFLTFVDGGIELLK